MIKFKSSIRTGSLTTQCACGHLIDLLVELCTRPPEYLRIEDATRYISILHELKHYEFTPWWIKDPAAVEVSVLPLYCLNNVLEHWVLSFFQTGEGRLMPHYALDMVRFMETIIYGTYRNEPEWWELEPAFEKQIRELLRFDFLDSGFKKRFTDLTDLEVIARVPDGVSLNYRNEPVLPSGSEFLFRCEDAI